MSLIGTRFKPERMARTLAETIAMWVREQIVSRQLAPGQPLIQEAIAEELKVSRVPVRDALRILAAEGLIELESHKGAVVTEFSIEDLKEILAIIRALEAIATSQGVHQLSDADLDEMHQILKRMSGATDEIREWSILNERFHSIGTVASYGKRIHKILDRHRLCISRYFHDPVLFNQEVDTWNSQHWEIYEACKKGDVEEAHRLADFHWDYSAKALLTHLANEKL